MTEIKRNIKCSNCGYEANVYINTEMNISELLMQGKCQRCGNSLQINYSLIDQKQTSSSTTDTGTSTTSVMPNLDETLFEPEFPSESIKELIDGE